MKQGKLFTTTHEDVSVSMSLLDSQQALQLAEDTAGTVMATTKNARKENSIQRNDKVAYRRNAKVKME